MAVEQGRVRIRAEENAGAFVDGPAGVVFVDGAFGFGDERVVAVAFDFGEEEILERSLKSWIRI